MTLAVDWAVNLNTNNQRRYTKVYRPVISPPSDNITMLNEAMVLCVNLNITFARLDRGVSSPFSHPFRISLTHVLPSPTLFSFYPPFLSLPQPFFHFFHPLYSLFPNLLFFLPPLTLLLQSPIPCLPASLSPF